jgi:ribonuclease HI
LNPRLYHKLKVRTNSEFIVDCIEFIPGWKQNKWTDSNGQPIDYKEEIQYLDEALSHLDDVQDQYSERPFSQGNIVDKFNYSSFTVV